MTASDIDKILRRNFSNFDYQLSNIFFFGQWESDFICRSSSEYWYEIEIKITRGDFKADFKKTEKYHRFSRAKQETVIIPGGSQSTYNRETLEFEEIANYITVVENKIPNRFYYACPEGVIKKSEVPDYAGLFYCKDNNHGSIVGLRQVKAAKFLHKRKDDYTKLLLHKYYYKFLELQYQLTRAKYEFQNMTDFYKYPGPNKKEPEEQTLF